MESAIIFYLLAAFILFTGLKVLLSPNPISCSLYLVLSMIGVAGVFFTLNAGFLAGVQLAVYAGAVMVLFVMVIMLFDLKYEVQAFSRGLFSRGLKVLSAAVILIFLVKAVFSQIPMEPVNRLSEDNMTTKYLAALLFTDYIFAFELLGILLLVIAIGVVALSRIKGGTHD